MATIKVIPIRASLRDCLDYAVNAEKTSEFGHLANSLGYINDGEKTAEARYVSGINCSHETAFRQMQTTKERYRKVNTVRQGYHMIQSFEPGEISDPALAHQIARELAAKVFPGFEIVVATHIDKHHIHNHIVFNSVSKFSGKMYDNQLGYLDRVIRAESDAICRRNGLSVVARQSRGRELGKIEYSDSDTGERVLKSALGKSRNRKAWDEEHGAEPPGKRRQLKLDIDAAIKDSRNWDEFCGKLREMGYAFRGSRGELKHESVTPPGGKRAFRFDSLGEGYTAGGIRRRIDEQIEDLAGRAYGGMQKEAARQLREGKVTLNAARLRAGEAPPLQSMTKKRVRVKGAYKPRPKLKGFRALYWRYLYLIGGAPRKRGNKRDKAQSRYVRAAKSDFKRIMAQDSFMRKHGLATESDVRLFKGAAADEIYRLSNERKQLRSLERFLRGNALTTASGVRMFAEAVGEDVYRLTRERKRLYNAKRYAVPEEQAELAARLASLNAELKNRRVQQTQINTLLRLFGADASPQRVKSKFAAIGAEITERQKQILLCEHIAEDSARIVSTLSEARRLAELQSAPKRNQRGRTEQRSERDSGLAY